MRTVLGGEVVALDGKSVRRALNAGEDMRMIVSAWATESGLLLGQRKTRDKSNEITVVPELLRALELAGCIITADALHCQKNIAKEILEADADYVLALKGNQPAAYGEIKTFLDDAVQRAIRRWPLWRRRTKATGVWKCGATGRPSRSRGLRTGQVGGLAQRGGGGERAQRARGVERGAALLPVEPAGGRGEAGAGRAGALED